MSKKAYTTIRAGCYGWTKIIPPKFKKDDEMSKKETVEKEGKKMNRKIYIKKYGKDITEKDKRIIDAMVFAFNRLQTDAKEIYEDLKTLAKEQLVDFEVEE